ECCHTVIKMSRWILCGAGAAALAVVGWRAWQLIPPEPVVVIKRNIPEAAPLCPWREPEADLKVLFPTATRYETETRILSGLRLELAARLGRMPTGDENALRVFHVFHEETPLGTVLLQRVKATSGAIEIVLALNTDSRVSGFLIQRLRESEPVTAVLLDQQWRQSFEGKDANSAWQLGQDIPGVPNEARASALAVIEGVKTLLILQAVADQARLKEPIPAGHH